MDKGSVVADVHSAEKTTRKSVKFLRLVRLCDCFIFSFSSVQLYSLYPFPLISAQIKDVERPRILLGLLLASGRSCVPVMWFCLVSNGVWWIMAAQKH